MTVKLSNFLLSHQNAIYPHFSIDYMVIYAKQTNLLVPRAPHPANTRIYAGFPSSSNFLASLLLVSTIGLYFTFSE